MDRQIYVVQSKPMILMYNQMATFCVNECILDKWQQSNVFDGFLSSDILRCLIKVWVSDNSKWSNLATSIR